MRNQICRIGLLGLDTSHGPTFTGILNNPYDPFFIPGAEVVAAFPGGSSDMPISASRVGGFTDELRSAYKIPIFDDPVKVAERSDFVFITAADGRVHLDLLTRTAPLGKPTFIDKPFVISVEQAEKMFVCAEGSGIRLFASSAFRYADPLVDFIVRARANRERILECEIHCWLPIEDTQGRYFWYGIHAAEMALLLLGTGATMINASGNSETDHIAVEYGDERKATILGSRRDSSFWVQVRTENRTVTIDLEPAMSSLSSRLLWTVLDVLSESKFPSLWRHTPQGSVSGNRPSRVLDPLPNETLEVIQILEAAGKSYVQGKGVAIATSLKHKEQYVNR
jgi:predicted dehydrogenase